MIEVVDLGRTRYADAWDLQKRTFELRLRGAIPDILLLNEHEPVYTFGRNSDPNHLLANEEELAKKGIDVCAIDRGGDVTYHGPGQIVGYPIFDLTGYHRDVDRYLRDLEEVLIGTLALYGIAARREAGLTGVWAGGEKIAAIGVRLSRWVTMHGFALNVNTDLSPFERIIPCGIFNRGVTSMERQLGRSVPLAEVSGRIVEQVGRVFGTAAVARDRAEFIDTTHHLENAECLH
jgi:lipoate-protein ligase B